MSWVAALRAELGDRVHTQPAELAAVARDASHVIGHPEALLYPETAAHVATAVRIARAVRRADRRPRRRHLADGRDGLHARRPRDRVQQDEGDPRARPRGAHRARAAGPAQRRARPRGTPPRPALRARPLLARGLRDRRQHRHERRRAALPRPRRHGRPRARHRGRVRRRQRSPGSRTPTPPTCARS